MTFYHRTLIPASGITHSVIGNFLEEKKEDIIVSTGRILKLLRFDLDNTSQAIQTLISVDTYDIIASLSKFRRESETKDWIVIAAESGTTTVLTINAERMEFELVIQEKFKVQSSKTLPIQHMAADSHGHAVFTAAIEEMKRILFFHGPGNRLLKFVDAPTKRVLIYDIAFVDIKSENIIVANLETAYEKELDPEVKCGIRKRYKPYLVFYKMDEDKLVEIRRIKCLDFANSLISVPGERGVLVCAEDFISFYSLDSTAIRCSIPKRIMDPKADVIFVCSTNCSGKLFQMSSNLEKGGCSIAGDSSTTQDSCYYYLAQTEQGDIFKIQVFTNEHGVNGIMLHYFLTLPVASALCTFESGFLFVASEFGDHHVYKIADIVQHAKVHPVFSSAMDCPEGKPFFFMHRILNIAPVAEIKSLSPIMHMEFKPTSRMESQMSLAIGRAFLSSLKIFDLGRDANYNFCAKIEKDDDEIPCHVWVIESTESISEESKTLIVVSFEYSTAVYSVEKASEHVIEKLKGTSFAEGTNTLGCAKTGEDAILQVCPEGVCLIGNKRNRLMYRSEKENLIQGCAINKKCLVIAVENKELIHYKIDVNGFVMMSNLPRRLLNGPVTCMLLSEISEIDQLLAVGIRSVKFREIHLYIIGLLEIKLLCMLKVDNSPYSFLFSDLKSLFVGCENGIVLSLAVEETNLTEETTKHELKVIKTEKIGTEAVQLLHAQILRKLKVGFGILAVSNHSWFKETAVGDFFQLKPDISPCVSRMLNESIVTILEDQLRIFILEDLPPAPPVTISLEYTPKKFVVDSNTGNIFIIETDNNSFTEESKEIKKKEFYMHVAAFKRQRPASELPDLKIIPKSWASLLRVVNVSGVNPREVFKLSYDQNEAAMSLCYLKRGDAELLLVGVAKDFKLNSECSKEAAIYTYKIWNQPEHISVLHKTVIKSAPLAMCCFQEFVLIGIGRKLALYDVKPESLELVMVCEKKDCVSSCITAIYLADDKRIYVSDSNLGTSCLVYHSNDRSLHLLEEDISPPEVAAACILSGNRMARATKSRNIFIVELGTLGDRDMSKASKNFQTPYMLSKEKMLGCFYVGEVVSSMQIFNNFLDELETVVFTTLSGTVGILSLLRQEKDTKFLDALQAALLKWAPEIDKKRSTLPISSNFWFRSRHYKSENIIDGDYLDEFLKLEVGLQEIICQEIKATDVTQITTKLEKIRRKNMLNIQL